MTPLYRTPMSGEVIIHWQMAVDEDGEIQGFVGTPKDDDATYGNLEDYAGAEIVFAVSVQAVDDESMARSMQAAVVHSIGTHIAPRVIRKLYDASIELRERQGGFVQELYDIRMAELRAEWEAAQEEDQSSD